MADLYLASHSPRRRELLKQIGVKFEPLMLRLTAPRGADVDEAQYPGEPAAAYVERIAREKALFGARVLAARSLPQKPVLTADTVVIVDGDVLGKPANAAEAASFLRRLAGRTHEVRTAVALALGGAAQPRLLLATSVSQVTFAPLSDAQIARYCESGEPYDKAGGYAIQGLAAVFVAHLAGSYSGVMGLPLYETAQLLRQAGVPVL
ncbi:MAG: Maf family protein [Sutterellaceae bacterium]|nr:Maf family nucleotide pyrophosphatase [Burkholderiaceae bacterium]MDW8428925.1 Maf family protein [Sutterellaceae bacterium]